ncbi:MAG: hypothetical protein A2Y33_02275 [Spirochaetes bacterium GWF1_51_8]|nr:MAG: hypothetical protein A2Y33_02275 [Spirochaetes bacterium GWF1_51_8]
MSGKAKITVKPKAEPKKKAIPKKSGSSKNPFKDIAKSALRFLAETGGYIKNDRIHIDLPPDLKEWAERLRMIGLGKQVDEMIEEMNKAAGKAVDKAADHFIDAMSGISLDEVGSMLFGGEDAVTKYLEKKTRKKMSKEFAPIIKDSMEEVGITRLFKKLLDAYNSIPLVPKIKFDLPMYVNNRALDGMYYILAREEIKVRRDPLGAAGKFLTNLLSPGSKSGG